MATFLLQEILVDRAVLTGIPRSVSIDLTFQEHEKPVLLGDDFLYAMQGFLPVSLRDITNAPGDRHAGWEDVGGLTEVSSTIKEVHIFLLALAQKQN
ncbi:hypothetical protein U1Q18_036506 [Sarracenia purpurea var. burkii]